MRRRANPDPTIESYTARSGREYAVTAWRNGNYEVRRDGELVYQQVNVTFGIGRNRFPSNRQQADAQASARNYI